MMNADLIARAAFAALFFLSHYFAASFSSFLVSCRDHAVPKSGQNSTSIRIRNIPVKKAMMLIGKTGTAVHVFFTAFVMKWKSPEIPAAK